MSESKEINTGELKEVNSSEKEEINTEPEKEVDGSEEKGLRHQTGKRARKLRNKLKRIEKKISQIKGEDWSDREKWKTAHMAEIYTMLMSLCTKFPKAFTTDEKKVRPLKIGIYEDLKAELGLKGKEKIWAKVQKRLLREALKIYTSSPVYLKQLSKGLYRVDLFGKRTERVINSQSNSAQIKLEEFDKK